MICSKATCLFVLSASLGAQIQLDPVTLTYPGRSVVTPVGVSGVGGANLASQDLVASEVLNGDLLEVNPANGSVGTRGKLGHPNIVGLAWHPNKVLYGVSNLTLELVTIDPASGKATVVGPFGSVIRYVHCLAFHLRQGKLYMAATAPSMELFTVDPATGFATKVGRHGLANLAGLTYDFVTDRMYAADVATRSLYTLDVKTAKPTLVGPFRAGVQVGVSLAFHPTLGLFATDNLANGQPDDVLYRIDARTGAATRVGAMNSANILGLEFVDQGCQSGSSRSYGTGHRGTNGAPTLNATPPMAGSVMTLSLSNSRNAATIGWLLLNQRKAARPAFWGGTLHVEFANSILWGVPVMASGLVQRIPVPASAACGATWFAQGVLVDPGASAGLSSTAGVEMRVGR